MTRQLGTVGLIAFLFASTAVFGESGVLCLMADQIQPHCCCHSSPNSGEDETDLPGLSRTCCEFSQEIADRPAATSADELCLVVGTLDADPPAQFPLRSNIARDVNGPISQPVRGPPDKRRYLRLQVFRI